MLIEGSASGGKHFSPQFTSSKDTAEVGQGFLFQPNRQRHSFRFEYDPKANKNLGRISVTLDDKTSSLDLTVEQRGDGAVFDRFGVANLRSGGKYVVVYFDDLTYTARRPRDYRRIVHKQEVVRVPYAW